MLRKKFLCFLWGHLQIFSQKGMERRHGSVKTWLFWLLCLCKCSISIWNIFLQYLLDKKEERHGRNLSGDSSGCSSGHESVSSSLTSDTRSSSDSGTEADQVRYLPWPIYRTETVASSASYFIVLCVIVTVITKCILLIGQHSVSRLIIWTECVMQEIEIILEFV